MKKLTLMALGLLGIVALSANAYAVNVPADEPQILKRGIGGKEFQPVRVYKLVRYAERMVVGTGLVSGDVVVYDINSDDGITVNVTTTSADAAVAGIAAMTIQTGDNSTAPTSAADDYGRRNWGYILVHGPMTMNVAAGGTNAPSAGDPWITSADAGKGCSFAPTSAVATTALTKKLGNRGGFFYNAPAAADTSTLVQVNLE